MSLTELQIGPARVLWTSGADGHLGRGNPEVPNNWPELKQVHGTTVVDTATVDTCFGSPIEADGCVTGDPDRPVGVKTADCAPIALISPQGFAAAIHAGWRGLYDGVVAQGVAVMRTKGASELIGVLGPCIHSCCYEYGESELVAFDNKWGGAVVAKTRRGTPSFDLPAAVASELQALDVPLEFVHPSCTCCDESFFSHRRNGTKDRQVTIVSL
jgi:polyphenol oxidase